ncbi:MAG: hypothetical protein WCT37_01175 [Patescibacteria group bacterium]|jgi:hypothetical protein
MALSILIKNIIKDVFTVSAVSWLVFCLAELYKTGLVTNYLNLNWFLLWCIFVGIIQLIDN